MLSVSTGNWKNTVLRSNLRSVLSYCFMSVKQTSVISTGPKHFRSVTERSYLLLGGLCKV